MDFSRGFIRLNWIALVLIYMVVIAGSFVRITGSGMGCPDWPKCFGEWIPPTSAEDLPENYREIYAEKRQKKIVKFCDFLRAIGYDEVAYELENDPSLTLEQAFNVRKTWTEYANRLVGFLSGNALLAAFIWMLIKFRRRKILIPAFINLVLMGIQAWFGSIVVASNLVPWTITVHMFLALVIIGIQLYIIYQISPRSKEGIPLQNWIRILIWVSFGITFYQMFLGTQVREAIDDLVLQGYTREQWVAELGMPFYIHRSFSWLVLILLSIIAWKNEKTDKNPLLRAVFVLLIIELISGILLAYVDMPGLVQTAHLLFASIIFGILTFLLFRLKSVMKVTD